MKLGQYLNIFQNGIHELSWKRLCENKEIVNILLKELKEFATGNFLSILIVCTVLAIHRVYCFRKTEKGRIAKETLSLS